MFIIKHCTQHYDMIYLNNRVDVNEVQTLDLMRFKSMWTFHAFQHTNDFLSHSTTYNRSSNSMSTDHYNISGVSVIMNNSVAFHQSYCYS